jgi:hypothetical protein
MLRYPQVPQAAPCWVEEKASFFLFKVSAKADKSAIALLLESATSGLATAADADAADDDEDEGVLIASMMTFRPTAAREP